MVNKKQNILIIGSGGREHALGWKLHQEGHRLFFAPGNGGTHALGTNVPIAVTEVSKLVSFAKDHAISMVVVGPEIPLARGIVDVFQKRGIPIFGPTKSAARLESSKSFAATFMKRHGIPQPKFKVFTNWRRAKKFVQDPPWTNFVIKADGLAAGKGVILPKNTDEALSAIDAIMVQKKFGTAGKKVIIQERLYGKEVSMIALADGTTVVPLLTSQDYKRAYDNDTGPNTGGMGVITPVPFVSGKLLQIITRTILKPTIIGMKKEGNPFTGVLYAGLMITPDGNPYVLEYNARFGDPEIQPLLLLMKSQLTPVLQACGNGTVRLSSIQFHKGSAACVVLAANGYPGTYKKGIRIPNFSIPNGVSVFHAGTIWKENSIQSSGGRVLNVVARGATLTKALHTVYAAIGPQKIQFARMHYRTDIGRNAE